jgi:uracil phosphoribosyltransferase
MIAQGSKVQVVDHPLAQHLLTRLRAHQTAPHQFRRYALEFSDFLVYEAARQMAVRKVAVETPVGPAEGAALSDYVILAPVLRAGLIMAEAAQKLMPAARIYHVGLKRDEETLEAKSYYEKLPSHLPNETRVYILDPMLATGGSAVSAIDLFVKLNVAHIQLVSFVAAPEGIKRVHDKHPNVHITTGSIDTKLNELGYIVPGLGDAGDRIFGT